MKRSLRIAIAAAAFIVPSAAHAQGEYDLDFKKDRIGPVSIAPKFGYVFDKYSDLINESGYLFGGMANGFNFQFDVDFSGDAGSLELAPFYTYRVTNLSEYQHWLGLYIGYAYRWKTFHGKLYPSLGVGLRSGFLINTASWAFVNENSIMFPAGLSYYLTRELAILGELGLGYTTLSFWNNNYLNYFLIGGFQLQVSMGVRWP